MFNPFKRRKGPFFYYFDSIEYIDVKNYHILNIIGWCFHKSNEEVTYDIYINNHKVKYEIIRMHRKDIVKIFKNNKALVDSGYKIIVDLGDNEFKNIRIVAKSHNQMHEILHTTAKKLKYHRVTTPINVSLDVLNINKTSYHYDIIGWGLSVSKRSINYNIKDQNNNIIEAKIQKVARDDLVNAGIVEKELLNCGFHISFDGKKDGKYRLIVNDGEFNQEYDIQKMKVNEKSLGYWLSKNGLVRIKKYVSNNSVKQIMKRIILGNDTNDVDYNKWVHEHPLTREKIEKQKKHDFNFSPKISLIVATFNTPINYLEAMIEAVINQTYTNWELCIADGSENQLVEDFVRSHYGNNDKIKYKKLSKNLGISGNMNAAIDMATGEYIGFYDHDDLITKDALYEYIKVLNKNNEIEFIYSDEDKIDAKGKKYFDPNFKPDFNLDLLTTVNYICHFLVVKKSLIDSVGPFDSDFDGAQDYDFVLRCVDAIDESKIYHIPKVLYHWRFHQGSTAGNPQSKMYAFEAGKRAVQSHFNRIGVKAQVDHGPSLGMYRTHYILETKPLVSIIIPSKDHIDDLKRCLNSIIKKSTYKNYEIIIVENNSIEKETFEYYDFIQKKYSNVHVVYWKKGFNFSAINNFGIQYAKGEYLLLLNNDTEVISENWIEEMLGICERKEVGIVGCKLLYPDDTIQHAGVLIGMGGLAGHVFVNYNKNDLGYFGYIQAQRDYSAVTAACMLVKRSVFDAVNGLTEELEVAFNDVDFCMKVINAGYKIVYTPYAQLHHYESKSRGYEDTPEKVERFNREVLYFLRHWKKFLEKGDPCYNKNLSLMTTDFKLKTDTHELDDFYKRYDF